MRFSRFSAGASLLAFLVVASLLIPPVVAQAKFYVCYINTVQKEVLQGKTVTVVFGVFYASPYYAPCGEPATLKPRTGQTQPTGSFYVTGSSVVRFTDIPITPTGKPGEYRAELSWPGDAPVGKVVAFVVKESLYDGKTTGPERETSHVETPDPIDDSTFASTRSAHPIVAFFDFMPGGFATFAALLSLLILLAVFFLILVRRRRKR